LALIHVSQIRVSDTNTVHHTTLPSPFCTAYYTPLNPLPISFFSSAFSPRELEDFFHATEVLTSNHRQYSIDALNATQLNREVDRDRDRERDGRRESDRDRDRDVEVDREKCDSIHSTNTADISNKKYKSNSNSSSTYPQSGAKSNSNSSSKSNSNPGSSGTTADSRPNTHQNNPSSRCESTNTAQHTQSHTHTHTEPGSGRTRSSNNHLNPFYEIGRMTADDLRNHRYNSGLEESEGSWCVTSRHVTPRHVTYL
jgi:hypothetical protein